MPERPTPPPAATRLAAILGAAAALLAAVASGVGVFLRGDLATTPFTTVRGELVEVVTSGPYRFDALTVASEGVGWDVVTLCLVVPALLLSLRGVWRGDLRPRLLACGLLAYLVYQYLEYAMFLAYGPLFLVFVGTFSLALCALLLVVATFDVADLAAGVSASFPRRGVIAMGAFMALLLAGMWLPGILTTLTATLVEQLDGATTLVVQALDLGLLVPLGIAAAVAAWRRLPVGYVLAPLVLVKAVAMATAIVAMLLVEGAETGVLAVPPIVVFAATAAAALAIGLRVFGSIDGSRATTREGATVDALARV